MPAADHADEEPADPDPDSDSDPVIAAERTTCSTHASSSG